MRNLGEIPHADCKISLFAWNGKHLVKFEQGLCEQTFKFEDLEFEGGESFIRSQINERFVAKVLASFTAMQSLRQEALEPT